MGTWSGALYTSATITGNGNSGWLSWQTIPSTAWPTRADPHPSAWYTAAAITQPSHLSLAPSSVLLRMEPAGVAGAETFDMVLALAYTSAGDGSFDIHDFTQVLVANVAENLVIPGEEDTGILTSGADLLPGAIPSHFKLTWTVGGGGEGVSFVLYAAMEISN